MADLKLTIDSPELQLIVDRLLELEYLVQLLVQHRHKHGLADVTHLPAVNSGEEFQYITVVSQQRTTEPTSTDAQWPVEEPTQATTPASLQQELATPNGPAEQGSECAHYRGYGHKWIPQTWYWDERWEPIPRMNLNCQCGASRLFVLTPAEVAAAQSLTLAKPDSEPSAERSEQTAPSPLAGWTEGWHQGYTAAKSEPTETASNECCCVDRNHYHEGKLGFWNSKTQEICYHCPRHGAEPRAFTWEDSTAESACSYWAVSGLHTWWPVNGFSWPLEGNEPWELVLKCPCGEFLHLRIERKMGASRE